MPSPFKAALKRLGTARSPAQKDKAGFNEPPQDKNIGGLSANHQSTGVQISNSPSTIFGPFAPEPVPFSSTAGSIGSGTPLGISLVQHKYNQRHAEVSNKTSSSTPIMPGDDQRFKGGRSHRTRRSSSKGRAPGNDRDNPIDLEANPSKPWRNLTDQAPDDDDDQDYPGPDTSGTLSNHLTSSLTTGMFKSGKIFGAKPSFDTFSSSGNSHLTAPKGGLHEPLIPGPTPTTTMLGPPPAAVTTGFVHGTGAHIVGNGTVQDAQKGKTIFGGIDAETPDPFGTLVPQPSWYAHPNMKSPNMLPGITLKKSLASAPPFIPKATGGSYYGGNEYGFAGFVDDEDDDCYEEDYSQDGDYRHTAVGGKASYKPSGGYTPSKLASFAMDVDPLQGLPVSMPNVPDEEEVEEDESQIPAEEKATLEQLQKYASGLSISCAGCNIKHTLKQDDIPKMTRKWATSTNSILCGIPCPGNGFCTTITCPSCNKAVVADNTLDSQRSFKVTMAGKQLAMTVCRGCGGAFAWWALTCGWDLPQKAKPSLGQTMAEKFTPRRSSRLQIALKKSAELRSGHSKEAEPMLRQDLQVKGGLANLPKQEPLNENRPLGNAKGTGYGGHSYSAALTKKISSYSRKGKTTYIPATADVQEDILHEAYFRLFAKLTSSTKLHDSESGATFTAMIARSPLIVRAAVLLSNDSLQDIAKQVGLYEALLEFLEALTNLGTTAHLVYDNQSIFAKSGLTLAVSYKQSAKSKITAKDTGRPLAYLLSRLARQGRTLIQHAAKHPEDFAGKAGMDFVALVQRLTCVSSLYDARMQQSRMEAMEIEGSEGKKPEASDWSKYHEKHAVDELPDEEVFRDHKFVGDAEKTTEKKPPPGRMKRLISEISTLQTSLPEGVFIRYGSSRLDVMKILIIGPKGTPYEFGFFEFDMFCGMDYPRIPPLMCFKTTGGGKVRFNPNLYPDGKSPSWKPEHSTILQLLVSIQSMIFCENPYYNEPGFESQENPAQAAKYNNDTRISTVQHAIRPWVNTIHASHDETQASAASPAWGAIAQTHLRCFGPSIHAAFSTASKAAIAAKSKESGRLDVVAIKLHKELENQGYLV